MNKILSFSNHPSPSRGTHLFIHPTFLFWRNRRFALSVGKISHHQWCFIGRECLGRAWHERTSPLSRRCSKNTEQRKKEEKSQSEEKLPEANWRRCTVPSGRYRKDTAAIKIGVSYCACLVGGLYRKNVTAIKQGVDQLFSHYRASNGCHNERLVTSGRCL